MVKMINPPLTDQQREALMRLLHDTGLNIATIAEMGRKVIGKTTYGNIAFEHWKNEIVEGVHRQPDTEPDRYCLDCESNHKWNEICPKLIDEEKGKT
jgi:hypothetical protein